jgi:hypothetical protein
MLLAEILETWVTVSAVVTVLAFIALVLALTWPR